MNYRSIKHLPTADQLIAKLPLSEAGYQQIQRDRDEVKAIIEGRDNRLLVVVGPCSAWPKEAVLTYAKKLGTTAVVALLRACFPLTLSSNPLSP